ncbi:histidinol-phosphatase [soil metagenome]
MTVAGYRALMQDARMQDLMEFAVDIARQAGRTALTHFRSDALVVDRKADTSPVTVADRAGEALLRELLAARFPDDAVVGEEHADTGGTTGRTWYLDPIDGTKSFVHGVPLFTTLVACWDPDGPLVGVIDAPALRETTWAGRGAGCFHDDCQARVSSVAALSEAYVMTSGSEWWPPDLRARATSGPFTLRTWGDGYGYSLVATGRAEAMVDPGAEVWDLAPLPVIISEAGGRLTGLDGTDGVGSGSAVASNGLVHDALLAHFG